MAERETGVDDNRLNTDCLLTFELQWHSEHYRDEPFIVAFWSDLMNTPLLTSSLLDPLEEDRRDQLRVSEDEDFSAPF